MGQPGCHPLTDAAGVEGKGKGNSQRQASCLAHQRMRCQQSLWQSRFKISPKRCTAGSSRLLIMVISQQSPVCSGISLVPSLLSLEAHKIMLGKVCCLCQCGDSAHRETASPQEQCYADVSCSSPSSRKPRVGNSTEGSVKALLGGEQAAAAPSSHHPAAPAPCPSSLTSGPPGHLWACSWPGSPG